MDRAGDFYIDGYDGRGGGVLLCGDKGGCVGWVVCMPTCCTAKVV